MQNDPTENNQTENSEENRDQETETISSEPESSDQETSPDKAKIISREEPFETGQIPENVPAETEASDREPFAEKAKIISVPKIPESNQLAEEGNEQPAPEQEQTGQDKSEDIFYYIRFRESDPSFSGASRISNLTIGEVVMAQTDHGLEPATVTSRGPQVSVMPEKKGARSTYILPRRANRDEINKFERLMEREKEAFDLCQQYIEKHALEMKLTRVERFFNGSKIIFYFTAENRVDFRELVKDLVQEFRTRVEIRQIGVRHETKMIGGLGCCGRELCCSSFIKNFSPVSIKMAKAQNLPLNPAKISGVCNRLLCCLTYEYDTYRKLRKGMPKIGKTITLEDTEYKVINNNILGETVTIISLDQPEQTRTLTREEWSSFDSKHQEHHQKQGKGKGQRQQSKKKGRSGKGHKTKHKQKDLLQKKEHSQEQSNK